MAGARGGEVEVRETQIEPNVINARVDTVARGDDTSGRPWDLSMFGVYATWGLLICKRS